MSDVKNEPKSVATSDSKNPAQSDASPAGHHNPRALGADFWNGEENHLLLNPRLLPATRALYETAWSRFVVGRLNSTVGIATSGSQGDMGRLILQRKESLLASSHAANERFAARSQDVWLRTLPTFHVGGLQIGARAYLAKSQVVESELSKWDARAFYNELESSQASLLSLVPTQLFDLVQLGLPAPRMLRAVIVGGGRLAVDLQRAARALGWPALPSYGLTECGSQVATAMPPGDDTRLWPLSHVEIRTDSTQRLSIKSAGLLSAQIRYQSGEWILEDPKQDGWFLTDDRAQIEADGTLTILGRNQDFVKIGGEGVLLSRLEETLDRLKLRQGLAVDAAVLLVVRDERLGAKLVLMSELEDRARTEKLARAFGESVMPYERIRELHHVNRIPRSALGKLLRLEALALVGLQPVVDVGRN